MKKALSLLSIILLLFCGGILLTACADDRVMIDCNLSTNDLTITHLAAYNSSVNRILTIKISTSYYTVKNVKVNIILVDNEGKSLNNIRNIPKSPTNLEFNLDELDEAYKTTFTYYKVNIVSGTISINKDFIFLRNGLPIQTNLINIY